MKSILISIILFLLFKNTSIAQNSSVKAIYLGDYKQFMFYARDSIVRNLLSLQLDDFNMYSKEGENLGINWDITISYKDEEILEVSTNHCDYYEHDYLFNYINGRLIVERKRFIYKPITGNVVNIFPDPVKLKELNLQIDTNLSIYNNWNKQFDNLDISPILNKDQKLAFKDWTMHKNLKKLNKTFTPRKIILTCDSTFDYKTRLNRKLTKNENGFQVHLFDNNKAVVLIGQYKSLYPQVKNGQFIFYTEGKISAKGYYQNNFPVGKWIKYDNNGKEEKVIDYSDVYEKLEYNNTNDTIYYIKDVDSLPKFMSEKYNDLTSYISQNFFTPPISKLSSMNMKNKMYFIVNKEGNIENVKIVEGNGIEFNIEIIRLLFSSPKWIPAQKNGKPVSVDFVLPFEF